MEPMSKESHSYVVNELLSWKQLVEDKIWAEKAVYTLVKRLTWTKDLVEELKLALSCHGASSKCITIPRTLDGRIQILHRKEFPHIIYCRIWRWPDLQSHDKLSALPECQFAFSNNLREICVNPYHYNRIPETLTCTENSVTGLDLDAARLTSSVLQPQSSNLVELQPRAHNSANSELVDELNIDDYEPMESQPLPQSTESQAPPQSTELQAPPQSTESKAPPQYTESQAPPQSTELQAPSQLINYDEPHYWATIAYYELNRRVGDIFNCKSTSIIVDGFTSPNKNGNRFCVGQLSNIHRNSTIESVRRHIGKGIHINYVNGEVYVECLSNSPIFVQSKVLNHINNYYPSTVCKISSGSSVKVFDDSEFVKLLSEYVNNTYESVHQLTEMCTIQISFVKGWGADYSRADISITPTWIEIHLNIPLKWLDRVLVEMGKPTGESV